MNAGQVLKSLAILALLWVVGFVSADTVKLAGREPFYRVQLVDFRGDRLVFRGVSRQYLRKLISHVDWFAVEGRPALNNAERAFAAGDWPRAVTGYEEALTRSDSRWLRRLIETRLLAAADRAGQFDRAVDRFVHLASRGPVPPEYVPRNPGPVGSPVNRAALATLKRAKSIKAPAGGEGALRRLQLELSIYEGYAGQPASEPVTETRPATTAPAERLGILPPMGDPPTVSPTSAPRPTLTADSFLLTAARTAIDAGRQPWAVGLLQRTLPHVRPADQTPYRLLLGRCWIDLGRYAQAASELMAVVAASSDARLTTTALYYVGLAHERMGRADVARQVYREASETFGVSTEIETLAREGLQRLQP